MPDIKTSNLTTKTGRPVSTDKILIVDTIDFTHGAGGTNKLIPFNDAVVNTIATDTADIRTNVTTLQTDVTTLKSYNRNGIFTHTTNATLATNTVLALVNSSSDITVTLPNANALPVATFINVKRLGTGNVIINPASGNTIDGITTYNFNTDSAVQFSSRRLVTDGSSAWYLI